MRPGLAIPTFLLIFLATIFSFAVLEQAQTPGPDSAKLELVPATVELPVNGEIEVQLVLRNKSPKFLNDVKLSWYTATGAMVKADESQDLAQLAPQAEKAWTLRLSQTPDGLVPGNAYFRTSFVSDVPQVLYGTLGITSRQADEVDQVVSVVPKTSSTVLKERNPVQVFLVINNKGNQPIRVGDITISGPGFVTSAPNWQGFTRDGNSFVRLEPRDSMNVPVEVNVKDAVRPGRHLMVFQVPVEWGAKDHLQKSTLIAQQEFDVGILGESEVLTALGVPSFLLLPGFLMIVAFTLLAKLQSKQDIAGESAWKLGVNPYVWVISITLSGFLAFAYPSLSKWVLKTPRNYLDGYGLYDVVVVWAGSVAIGVVAWVVFQTLLRIWSWLFIPSGTDGPLGILRKLHLQGLGTNLERVEVQINNAPQQVFLLQKRKDNVENIWIGPSIEICWLKGENKNPNLKKHIGYRLQPTADNLLKWPTLVLRWWLLRFFLWQAGRTQEITVAWKPSGSLASAQRVAMPKNRGGPVMITSEKDKV